jgi:hypothetical protein
VFQCFEVLESEAVTVQNLQNVASRRRLGPHHVCGTFLFNAFCYVVGVAIASSLSQTLN